VNRRANDAAKRRQGASRTAHPRMHRGARLAPLTPRVRCAPIASMRLPLVALAVVLVSVIGCGQSVATCDSDCTTLTPTAFSALPRSNPTPSLCEATCTANQTTATVDGRGADFQLLLTCIGNAGSFASECAPLACGLTGAFGPPTGCTSDAGLSPPIRDASTPDTFVVVVLTPDTGTGQDASTACTSAGGACVVPSGFDCAFVPGSPSCGAGLMCCGEGEH